MRDEVSTGHVAEAVRLLGRPHRVRGTVVPGRGGGDALGAPTANLSAPPGALLPADGVYAGFALREDGRHAAALSVGAPPSFPGAPPALEAHLIGFDADLYGEDLTVEFVERLRDQRAFVSEDALADAIARDVRRVQALLDR